MSGDCQREALSLPEKLLPKRFEAYAEHVIRSGALR